MANLHKTTQNQSPCQQTQKVWSATHTLNWSCCHSGNLLAISPPPPKAMHTHTFMALFLLVALIHFTSRQFDTRHLACWPPLLILFSLCFDDRVCLNPKLLLPPRAKCRDLPPTLLVVQKANNCREQPPPRFSKFLLNKVVVFRGSNLRRRKNMNINKSMKISGDLNDLCSY